MNDYSITNSSKLNNPRLSILGEDTFDTIFYKKDFTDIIHIDKNNDNYISLKDLKSKIELLSKNHHILIKDLDKHSKLLLNFTYINNLIHHIEDKNILHTLSQIIEKQYKPVDLKIDSIGSFLFGCSQVIYGDINKYCSPLCYNSLFNSTIVNCNKQIWIQNEEGINNIVRFTHKYGDKLPEAYIFITKDPFKGFSETEINLFKDNGIIKLTVLITHKSKHNIIYRSSLLSNLPIINNREDIPLTSIKKVKSNHINKVYPYYNFLLFLIICIIIVLCLIMFKYYSNAIQR